MPPCVLDQLRGRVEPHRLRVEHPGQEAACFVPLHPAAAVGKQGEAGSMAFREAVFAEALDLLEDVVCEVPFIPTIDHPVHQAVIEDADVTMVFPCSHRAPQPVGLSGREAGGKDRDLHHLLLEDRHSQRAPKCFLEGFTRIGDELRMQSPLQVGMHHAALDRTRTDDGHLHHQVIELAWPQPGKHRHLGPAFDLEHADRVGSADHVVGCLVFFRDLRQRPALAPPTLSELQRPAQCSEHSQRQHIHLHQPHCFEVVLFPLDDGAVLHRSVFHRHQAGQLRLGQHEAADMLAQVPWKAAQLECQLQPVVDLPRLLRNTDRLRHFQQAFVEDFAVEPEVIFRESVDQSFVHTECLAYIADRHPGTVTHDHCSNSRPLATVFPVDVLDHFFTPLVLKIDVDVRRLVALDADEALEQQAGHLRRHLRDVQAVADR